MSIVIPSELPEDVELWTTEHVRDFLEANTNQHPLDADVIRILETKEISGSALPLVDVKDFYNYGLDIELAERIMPLIDTLKVQKGLVKIGKAFPLVVYFIRRRAHSRHVGIMYNALYANNPFILQIFSVNLTFSSSAHPVLNTSPILAKLEALESGHPSLLACRTLSLHGMTSITA
jgi:hypothetical protein